jgi:hypothetical protein
LKKPDGSRHEDFKTLEIALSREALSSHLKDDLFAVADCVADKDTAVNLYLMGMK